jgi:hypothetical protein
MAHKKTNEPVPSSLAKEGQHHGPDSATVPFVALVRDPEPPQENVPDSSTGPVTIPTTVTLETPEVQPVSFDGNLPLKLDSERPTKPDSTDLLQALRDARQKTRSDLQKPNLDFARMTRAAEKAEWLRARFEALAASRNSDLDTEYTDVSTTADGLTQHLTENTSILSDAHVPAGIPDIMSPVPEPLQIVVQLSLPETRAPLLSDERASTIPVMNLVKEFGTNDAHIVREVAPSATVAISGNDVSLSSYLDESQVSGNFEVPLKQKDVHQKNDSVCETELSVADSLIHPVVEDPLKASIGVGSLHGFDKRLKELVLKQKAATKIQKWFKMALTKKKANAWRLHPDKDAMCSRLARVLFQPDRVLKQASISETDDIPQILSQKDPSTLKLDKSYLVMPKTDKFGLHVPQKDEFCVMKIFERNFVAGREIPAQTTKGGIQDIMDISETDPVSEREPRRASRKSRSLSATEKEIKTTSIFKPKFTESSQSAGYLEDQSSGLEETSDGSFLSSGPPAEGSISFDFTDSRKDHLERPAIPSNETSDLSENSLSSTQKTIGKIERC